MQAATKPFLTVRFAILQVDKNSRALHKEMIDSRSLTPLNLKG
jgi:hypothetical protein